MAHLTRPGGGPADKQHSYLWRGVHHKAACRGSWQLDQKFQIQHFQQLYLENRYCEQVSAGQSTSGPIRVQSGRKQEAAWLWSIAAHCNMKTCTNIKPQAVSKWLNWQRTNLIGPFKSDRQLVSTNLLCTWWCQSLETLRIIERVGL